MKLAGNCVNRSGSSVCEAVDDAGRGSVGGGSSGSGSGISGNGGGRQALGVTLVMVILKETKGQ